MLSTFSSHAQIKMESGLIWQQQVLSIIINLDCVHTMPTHFDNGVKYGE